MQSLYRFSSGGRRHEWHRPSLGKEGEVRYVQSFGELREGERLQAGGKGAALARMVQAGYPVPEGFAVLPAAFVDDELRADAWREVQEHLGRLRRNGDTAFAVRSSALSEESRAAAFAGEFETVLDVHTDAMIREAIETVRRSRKSERVRAYSETQGLAAAHEMAVLVQRLVRADISGVLFTADPVTGDLMRMTGNMR